jgi:hypothetical protein
VCQLVEQHLARVVAHCEVSASTPTDCAAALRAAEGHAFDLLEGGLLRRPVGEHRAARHVDQLQLVLRLEQQKDIAQNTLKKRNSIAYQYTPDQHHPQQRSTTSQCNAMNLLLRHSVTYLVRRNGEDLSRGMEARRRDGRGKVHHTLQRLRHSTCTRVGSTQGKVVTTGETVAVRAKHRNDTGLRPHSEVRAGQVVGHGAEAGAGCGMAVGWGVGAEVGGARAVIVRKSTQRKQPHISGR